MRILVLGANGFIGSAVTAGLMSRGHDVTGLAREIAAALRISEETIQVHVRNILLKLEAKDRTAAVNIGLRRGIIHIR